MRHAHTSLPLLASLLLTSVLPSIAELVQIAGKTGTASRYDAATGPPIMTLTWKNGEVLPGHLVSATGDTLSWQSSLFREPIEPALHTLRQIDFGADPSALGLVPATDLKTSTTSLTVRGTKRTGRSQTVTFVNQLTSDVDLHWLDENGAKKRYGRIKAGAKKTQPTMDGHMWLITDTSGENIAVVEVKASIKNVIIDGKGSPAEAPKEHAKSSEQVAKDPFAIRMRDGCVIHGGILEADAQTIKVSTASHGELKLKRSEVVRLIRISGDDVTFAGPGKPSAWIDNNTRYNSRDGVPRTPIWAAQDRGYLKTFSLGLKFQLKTELPEGMRLDLIIRSPKRPQFALDISSGTTGLLTLETWGQEVVLHGATQFVSLLKLKDEDHVVSLTLFWDAKAKRFAAFRPDGSPLCEWQTDADTKKVGRFTISNQQKPDFKGLQFTNKCPEIILEHLRVSKWSGWTPDKHDGGKPRVNLLDGHVVEGDIIRATADSVVVKVRGSGEEKTIAMKDVDSLHFTPEPLKNPPALQAKIWCEDDAYIGGKFQRADNGTVALQTSFSDEPVPTNLTALKTVKLDVPAPEGTPEEVPLAKLDRVNLGPTGVHGTWVSTGDAELRWLPVGCTKPVSLASNAGAFEISKVMAADGKFPRSAGLLHLSTGDILPGSITSLDSNEATLDAPLLGINTLPTKLIKCVQFGNTELKTQGFQDGGWTIARGTNKNVRRDGDVVTLDPGGAFGHPSILQGDDIRFSVIGDRGMGVVRVRLYCNGADASSPSTSLLFAHYGSSFYAGLETSEGQMQSRCQMKASGKVACRLQLRAKEIEIFLNNASMLKIPTANQKRSGLGLVFESGDLWGNGARSVVVSDFSVRPNPGKPWVPAVDAVARGQALLVPRFRKEDPPKQVLIAANGDILRGELTAATNSHLAFRSGLESLQVPRDRVAAAIWLQKAEEKKPDEAPPKTETPKSDPSKAASPPDDGSTHWLQLTGGARFGLKVTKFETDAITGSSPLVGQCRIPIENIFKIRTAKPAPDGVSHAFDEWKLEFAPEPVLPENGAQSSPLLGKETKDFTLPMLGDQKFELGKQKGKVVVLDFWATWCAPCIKSLPELIEAMAPFPADKVQFIGVNQGEAKEQVSKFLAQREWKMNVALDSTQSVGRQFGVEGIPHTVIVGPDGKVAWVKTGYAKENAAEAAETVKKLMK